MIEVEFNFAHFSTLECMVPPRNPGGGYGDATLPGGMTGYSGMYVILNITDPHLHNRYIGISTNIEQRFSGRLAVVVEMGFNVNTMERIGVWWGKASYRINGGSWSVIPPPAQGSMTQSINGEDVNLEHLLIRLVMTKLRPQVDSTVSNTLLNGPYQNPTGVQINVTTHWAAAAAFNLQGISENYTWGVSEQW